MPRYIDAQKLKDAMNIEDDTNGYFNIMTALKCVDEAPTADVQEVRHGRWNTINSKVTQCSVCGVYRVCRVRRDIRTQVGWNFCPVCGAKMDEEEPT